MESFVSQAVVGDRPRVLVTGATGFVGGALLGPLGAHGWDVRALTRRTRRSGRADAAGVQWVTGDLADEPSLQRALVGCEAALYLVHAMGDGPDFRRREAFEAKAFARAAAASGVSRIVYLGGIAPRAPSQHLASRAEVGAILRQGAVPAIEVRASMIVGPGSLSWQIVRDLAARLPVMVMPRWLKSRTQPVAIDDVVTAVLGALSLPAAGSAVFDLPGPEILSVAQILDQAAAALGFRPPLRIEVPLLTPRVSSLWLRLITRARWSVAREVVQGLSHDLLAEGRSLWPLIAAPARLTFAEAARRTLAAERAAGGEAGPWGVVEDIRRAFSLRAAAGRG